MDLVWIAVNRRVFPAAIDHNGRSPCGFRKVHEEANHADHGGGICENQLSLEQTCAIQKLRGALPPSSKDAAKALAACSGTPEFTLQIRDARVAAADDLRGAVVDRFVFVVHPNDPATGVAVLSVFADYVPVATP